MTVGPGKYDDLCTMVREKANADWAIVLIGGGDRGNGFSCQTSDLAVMVSLPDMLESIARQIRRDSQGETRQ